MTPSPARVDQHPDFPAFIRAVHENPTDPTPRLVFADWLREHGNPDWADMIRLHFGLEESPYPQWVFDEWDSRPKLEDLGGVIPGIPAGWSLLRYPNSEFPYPICLFRRGFVHQVQCLAEEWEEHAATILAVHPVRVVHLLVPHPPDGPRFWERAREATERIQQAVIPRFQAGYPQVPADGWTTGLLDYPRARRAR